MQVEGRIENVNDKHFSVDKLPCLYLIGFFCLYLRGIASSLTFLDLSIEADKILLIVGCVSLFLHCLECMKLRGTTLVLFILTLVLMFIVYMKSGESAPLYIAILFIASASIKDIDSVIRIWAYSTLSIFVIAAFSYLTSLFLTPEALEIMHRSDVLGNIGNIRHALNFTHPNTTGAVLLMLCCAFAYLRFDSFSLLDCLLIASSSAFTAFVVDSKTSAILIGAILVFVLIQKRDMKVFDRKSLLVLSLLPWALFLITLLLAGPLYSESLEHALTGRIWLWHTYLDYDGISLFGRSLHISAGLLSSGEVGYANTLDSFYAYGLFILGIVFSTVFCLLASRRIRISGVSKKYRNGLFVIIVALIFGFTESHLLNIVLILPILILSQGILDGLSVKKYPINTNRVASCD